MSATLCVQGLEDSDLKAHENHQLRCVTHGEAHQPYKYIAIECNDCSSLILTCEFLRYLNEMLVVFNKPEEEENDGG